MKINKLVSVPDVEVEIELCKDDLYDLFMELKPDDRAGVILYHLNNIAAFLRAISAETITTMNPAQRKLIREFLGEQSKRFEEKTTN
jgi:hypothetical protein